jgi:hypothetical protein
MTKLGKICICLLKREPFGAGAGKPVCHFLMPCKNHGQQMPCAVD